MELMCQCEQTFLRHLAYLVEGEEGLNFSIYKMTVSDLFEKV